MAGFNRLYEIGEVQSATIAAADSPAGVLHRNDGVYLLKPAGSGATSWLVVETRKGRTIEMHISEGSGTERTGFPLWIPMDVKRVFYRLRNGQTDRDVYPGEIYVLFRDHDKVGYIDNQAPVLTAGYGGGEVKRNAGANTDVVSITAADPDDDGVSLAIKDGFTHDYFGTGNQITWDSTDNKFVYNRITADEFPTGGVTVEVPVVVTDDFAVPDAIADNPDLLQRGGEEQSVEFTIPIRLLPSDDNAITNVKATPDGGTAVTDTSGTGTGADDQNRAVYNIEVPPSAHLDDVEIEVTPAEATFTEVNWGTQGNVNPLTVQPDGRKVFNSYPFFVEAEDGTRRYGELRLTIELPEAAGISIGVPTNVALDPTFDGATNEYGITPDLMSGVATMTFIVTRVAPQGWRYRVGGAEWRDITFSGGSTIGAVTITEIADTRELAVDFEVGHDQDSVVDDRVSRIYTVTLTVDPPRLNRLRGLPGALDPSFDAETFEYDWVVDSGTERVGLEARAEGDAVLEESRNNVDYRPHDDGAGISFGDLRVGTTNAYFRVTANGESQVYTVGIVIPRARLSSVAAADGHPDFTPVFDPDGVRYDVDLASGTQSYVMDIVRFNTNQIVDFRETNSGEGFDTLSDGTNALTLQATFSHLRVGQNIGRLIVRANHSTRTADFYLQVAEPRLAGASVGGGSTLQPAFGVNHYVYTVQAGTASSQEFTITRQNANQEARYRVAGGSWTTVAAGDWSSNEATFTATLAAHPATTFVEVEVMANEGSQAYHFTVHRTG